MSCAGEPLRAAALAGEGRGDLAASFKGSFEGYIDKGVDIDIDMDVDSDMAVSRKFAVLQKGLGAPLKGLGG